MLHDLDRIGDGFPFHITTFNVGLLDVTIGDHVIFEFAPFTRLRVDAVQRALLEHEADVVCLQELFHHADAVKITTALKHKWPYWSIAKKASSVGFGAGLVTLSRYPILNEQVHTFRAQTITERLIAKKALHVCEIEHPKLGNLFVGNTHLTAGGLFVHPESERAERVRTRQIQELFEQVGNEKSPTLICGDFNCGPAVSDSNFLGLLQRNFANACRSQNDSEFFVTWDPQNPLNLNSPHKTSPPQRIDHILFSSDLVSRVKDLVVRRVFDVPISLTDGSIVTPSDHYGVALEVCVN
jgi:endonuclease/exonuclease/phosphatase family metal-dependent hydrolase